MRNWQSYARCKDMDLDLFFPPGESDECLGAKEVCRRCTVRPACLKYALEERIEFGVFGGLTPIERRRIRRKRGEIRRTGTIKPMDEPVTPYARRGPRVVLSGVYHGERWAYNKGCRCDECTDADSLYSRARKQQANGVG